MQAAAALAQFERNLMRSLGRDKSEVIVRLIGSVSPTTVRYVSQEHTKYG